MPDTKITDLATGTTVVPGDWLVYVDISDTTMAATGTDKKLSPTVLLAGLATDALVVHLAGAETISGVKAFSQTITGNISGNAGTVTNGVYTTGAGTVYLAPSGSGAALTALNAAQLTTGTVPIGRLGASGTPSPSTFLRGDNAWQTPVSAPTGSKYILQVADGSLPNAQALAALGTGILKSTTATGVLSLAAASDLPTITLTGNVTGAASGGSIVTTIPAGTLSYAMNANTSGLTLLGNPTGSPAAQSEITLAPNLAFVGSVLRGSVPVWQGLSPGTAVANTAAATSIFTGITTQQGSLTLPTLAVGHIIRPYLFGQMTVGTGTPTLTYQFLLGGVVLFSQVGTALTATVSSGVVLITPMTFFQVQSIGASGKIFGMVWAYQTHSNPLAAITLVGGTQGASSPAWGAPTLITVNTVNPVFDIRVQWSAALAANSVQFLGGGLYLDYPNA